MSAPTSNGRRSAFVPLRILLVLVLLITVMAAMLALRSNLRADVSEAITFAAVGFVVLAAYAMAELAATIGLPRVTGYILAGIALGPSAASMAGIDPPLLSEASIGDMGIFKSLALALIALEAGLELSLDSLRRFKRTLAGIILFKVPLAWILVGGATVGLGMWVFPIAGVDSMGSLLALALVLGAISIGTSPAVSVAVISETGAKGKTPDLVLGFAVFKDVVMVIMLGFAIAIGNPLATGAEFDGAILVGLLETIGVSILLGVVLGGLLIAWMRWIAWENILMLLVLSYGIQPLETWFHHDLHIHLKPLLIFIAAGFVVGNFSKYGHELHKPLALLALPVFVIFFTTAGADLDLDETIAVLPLAASLFVVRLAMMYLATRFGGAIGRESRSYTDVLWLGFISQAGVGLVLLGVAIDQMPAIAGPLQQVGFALIALNLIVGPVLLRLALKKGPEALARADSGPPRPEIADVAATLPLPAKVSRELFEVDDAVRRLAHGPGRELVEHWWQQVELARAEGRALEAVPLAPLASALRSGVRELRAHLINLPVAVQLPIDPTLLSSYSSPSLRRRLTLLRGKVAYTLGRRHRRVALRSIVRARIERDIIHTLSALLDDVARAEIERLHTYEQRLTKSGESHQAKAVPEFDRSTADAILASFDERIEATLAALFASVPVAGTAYATGPRTYADVSREVDRHVRQLDGDGLAWDAAIAKVVARVSLYERLLEAKARIWEQCNQALYEWTVSRRSRILSILERFDDALEQAANAMRTASVADDSLDASVLLPLDDLASKEITPAIGDIRRGEGGAALKSLESGLSRLVPELPDTLLVATAPKPHEARRPADVRGEEREVASTVSHFIDEELHWSLAETRAEDDYVGTRIAQRLLEVVGMVTVGLVAGLEEIRLREAPDSPQLDGSLRAFVARTVHKARRAVDELEKYATTELDRVTENVARSVDDTFARVLRHLLGQPGERGDEDGSRGARLWRTGRRADEAVRRAAKRMSTWVGQGYRSWRGANLDKRRQAQPELLDPALMAAEIASLSPSSERLTRMPYVLARLFTPGIADTPQLLIGVEAQVDALTAAHDRFLNGQRAAVLVHGAAGSGATSMTSVTMRQLVGRDLVDIELGPKHRSEAALCESIGIQLGAPGARDFASLRRALVASRRVILLDGLGHLFTRTRDGIALMREVLGLIGATRDHTLWICTITDPTAQVLERLTDLSAYFTDHIPLSPQGPEVLGAIFESRCRLSGFEIVWPGSEGQTRSTVAPWLRRRNPTTDELRKRYLARMARLSGGNLRDALNLFVNSIEEVGVDFVRPAMPSSPTIAWFDQLGRDAHRLLAVTMVSETLTVSEAREALLFTSARLAAAHSRLLGAGLIETLADDERFRVRQDAWRRVHDLLVERNELVATPFRLVRPA